MALYRFDTTSFGPVVAHEGVGMIRTRRVADGVDHQGVNFIDMTEIPPGHSIGIHRHDGDDEEGKGTMYLGQDCFEVGPGDVVVNPPFGEHGLVNTGMEVLQLVVLDVPV